MRNTQDLKQSKISRHENAKQKFRFFERSLSTKSFHNVNLLTKNKKKEFVPIPGQFAILSNKKQKQGSQLPFLKIQQGQLRQKERQDSLRFTTNLKLITRQRSPSRVSEVLNETVNKKVIEQGSHRKLPRPSSSTNIRPHTAVISSKLATDLQGKSSIQQSPLVLNAMQYDKKYYIKKQLNQGNSFMVKSRSTMPKHVYGFKSIKLTQQDTQKKLKIQTQHEIRTDGRKFTKMPIEVKQKQQSKHQQEQPLTDKNETCPNFLPIEYYMMDDMRPQQLMQKYSMNDNYMIGYSKWQNVQGNYQWRKCRVIDYLKDKQRWQIQWLHNGKRKIVGRNNLYFQKEDFEHYQMIIKNAQQFRKRSEVFMKYNWLIDRMTTSTNQIQDHQLNSIIKLLGKFVPVEIFDNLLSLSDKSYSVEGKKTKEKLANKLINEVRQKYIRANHAVQFNSSLPYSIKHKQQFRGYLPESYFTPNSAITTFTLTTNHELESQKKIHSKKVISEEGSQKLINTSSSVHTSCDMKKIFEQGQKKFLKITALTSIYRIQIIEFLNKSEVAIVNLRVPPAYDITYSKDQVKIPQNQLKYFAFYSNKLYDLQEVQKKLQDTLFDSLTRMNTMVCEVQYCISKEMDPIYLDRKMIGYNNFDDMVDHYRRFLMTVNMRIQKMGKSVLLGMMRELADLLRGSQQILGKKQAQQYWKALQSEKSSHRELKIKILFELKSETLECTPSMENVILWLQGYGKKMVDSFGKLSCIRKSYIEELRPGNKMKICQSLQEDNQGNIIWKQNQQLISAKSALSQSIQQCKEIFEGVFTKVKGIVDKVYSLQTEIRKKNWKKCSFGEIEQYRRAISQVKQTLIRLKLLSLNSTIIFSPTNIKKNPTTTTGQSSSSGRKTASQRSMQSIKTSTVPKILSSPQQQQQQDHPIQQEQTSQRSKFIQLLQSSLQSNYRFIKSSVFIFQINQVLIKTQLRLIQLQKQLYKLLVQKIYKQSEKIQKQLQLIKQKVQQQPKNIKQMIQLQHYLNEQAQLQLNKVINKMIEIQHNFTLIQTTQLDYKDFYDCHKVILKPLKIRTLMSQKLVLIDVEYKKKFGEELMKQVAELSKEMKQIEEKFYITIEIKSLEEMNASFMTFSKLKERIENALAKSVQVNDFQTAMKWINTSFQRLVEIKDQFMPYYQLITLSKHYNFHLTLQINQPLHTIDAKKITQDVLNAINQLVVLEFQTFAKHQVMLEIVRKVAISYKSFKEKLPLMQILRNPDLRERHWSSIKELTSYNDILSDKITFTELQQRGIKKFEKKLIEISHIATRELIYEKKLNKMKKQWKQLKIQTKIIPSLQKPSPSENNITSSTANDIRVICNSDEIRAKTQNDIYQIQEILASSFIKFLQKDVLFWRNQTLYKMYEFIEIWKLIEKQFVPYWKMFSRSAIKNQAPNQYQKFKALEKNWRNLTQTIEQQPNVIELLQTKINDSIKYTVELIDDLKKAVTQFFETKKQKFSRFGALSQEQLIALYSNSNQQKQVFDQAVRKCLQGVKGVVRDDKNRITIIKTHLDEEINLNEQGGHVRDSMQDEDDLSPDKIIEDIEKKIKRSLRSSIDKIEEKSAKILQIVLFHQRIVFTREIESQLFDIDNDDDEGPGIKQGYLNALIGLKSQIISVLLGICNKGSQGQGKNGNNVPKNLIKVQAELNQLINHSEIAEWLYRKNVTEIFDFEWISQIRTYHNSGNYTIHCGLNKTDYGFEITDQQNYIVEKSSMRTFCHLSMATTQRMFNILSGKIGEGKLSSLHYLANIHGRNQLVMGCHQAISYDNIIDSFRMCANGIWIVFNNLNLLTPQVLSVFAQALQLLWINYPTQKSKGYIMLGDKNVMFTTHEINLFAKININNKNLSELSQISSRLSTYFRTYSVTPLDVQYILEIKLILAGLQCPNPLRFFHMIELIECECEIFYRYQQQQGVHTQGQLNFSKLNFIQKAIKYAKQFKQKSNTTTTKRIQQFVYLQQGLQKAIMDITMNLPQLKSHILSKLSIYFDFLPQKIQPITQSSSLSNNNNTRITLQSQGNNTNNNQDIRSNIKKLFTDNKLYCSRYTIQRYASILTTLQQKHSVIILGDCSTGKSQLINLLHENRIKLRRKFSLISNNLQDEFSYIDDFKIQLTYIHPNAYSLTELFGDVNKNGVVNSLIKKAYERLDKEKGKDKRKMLQRKGSALNNIQLKTIGQQQQPQQQHQPFTNIGLVFDSQIGPWIQPLLPLIKSNNTYIQPNGKTVIIQHPLKLIFQCRNLSTVSPSIILATNIVHLDNNSLKWQHMFAQYLRMNFSQEQFKQKQFLDYCECLVTFVLEPTLEFFKSSVTNFNAKMNATNGRHSKTTSGKENIFVELIYNSFLKNQANFVPLIFNLFIALVQSHFQPILEKQSTDRKNKQRSSAFSSLLSTQKEQIQETNLHSFLDDKNRSIVFNLFNMAITWTVGLIIPEQSKKTFSRHFKYLIKRAIQLNIKNIEKDSLPKDQDDIYEICFFNDKWHTWEEVISQRTKVKLTMNDSNNFSMTNQDRVSIPIKTKFKYVFLFQQYSRARQPFFLLGKSSTGKNSLMLDFISTLPQQTYNSILLTCTPQTTHKHTKYQLKKQIQQEKYSHKYEGFVNGKYKIFYLCDMNLPLKKGDYSLNEFVHQYVKSQGWYLNSSSEFFKFRNVIFCGTLNSGLSFSQQLVRFINPIPYVECDADIKMTLFSILNCNELISPYGDKLVKLMMNLQEVICRQFKHIGAGRAISFRDQCDIAENLKFKVTGRLFDNNIKGSQRSMKILQGGNSNDSLEKDMRNKILQCWIIETQQKYQQVMGPQYDQEKIYYFINNVLMEEQRLRYKSILPKSDFFLSNISYYASRIFTMEKPSTNKKLKNTKILLLPHSYKIYEGLPSIKEEIQSLQTYVNRTFTKLEETDHLQKRFSFAKQIRLAISNKKHPKIAISYLRSMQCILDFFLQQKTRLIIFVNENQKATKIQQKEQVQTTIKQLFEFNTAKARNIQDKDDEKSKKQHASQLQKLFGFASNILKSHVVSFDHQKSSHQTRTQWKLFLSQLFELINSPLSNQLNDYYVVYIKDIKDSEYFILEDFLGLIRMGVLKVLEDYINSEEFESEEIGKSEVYQKVVKTPIQNDSVIYEESIDQSDHSFSEEVQRKRIQEQHKRIQEMRKMNIAQLMRQKVLKKIKFVVQLTEDKMQKLKENYSVLFEKSHMLWSSQLLSISSKRTKSQIEIKDSQKQLSSISGGSRRSLTSQMGLHNDEISNRVKQVKQDDFVLMMRKQYHDHKQSLTQLLSFNEIRRVYLSLLEETVPKEGLSQIEKEIQLGENSQFLQFLNLRKNLQQGVQSRVQEKISAADLYLQYIITLSSILLQQLLQRISEQTALIQSKENQLSVMAKQIQQLSEENEKFLKIFLNLQNSMNLLENQSRQSNELYHQAIKHEEKNFFTSQFLLVDLLKTAKDKKIFMTNEMKACLEVFGLVINKKLKPEESMIKEIVRDIGALKVHKKVTNVFVQLPIGQKLGEKQTLIGEKALRKLKQFVTKNIMPELTKYIEMKQEYSYPKDKLKQSSFSENLLNLLKDYLIFFIIFHNKAQEEQVQQLNKKCTKILKQLAKIKEQLHKAQKNKNYQKITKDLEELKKKRACILQSYDQQHKYLQCLLSIQKKSLQVNSMSINGQIDQTMIAIKSSIETLMNYEPSERSRNLVVQRIKDKFYKQKQSLVSIRNCKEMTSLLIACRFKINQLQIQDTKMGNVGKIVSRQTMETLQRFKIPIWDQLFPQINKKDDESQKNNQKPDVIGYFIQEFDLKKTFKLFNGVIITSNQYQSKWVKKSQAQRLFSFNPNLNMESIASVLESKENQNLNNGNSSNFGKTAFLTDVSSLDEIKELLLMILQNQNLINLLSIKHKIIIFIDSEMKSQMSSTEAQKIYLNQTNNLKVNYLQFDNKKSQSQAIILNLFQQKLQQELCSDKKQSDNKLANHYRELKQSQLQNDQQTKSLIKSFNLLESLTQSLSHLPTRDHLQQQSQIIINPTKLDATQLQQQLNRSQHMNKLEAHLLDLKQIFLEYASISSQLESIINTSNLKKKSNIFTTKLLKYLARAYQGIEILKSQGLVLNHYSLQRFLNSVADIVRSEKQKQRGQFNQSKLFKCAKNKLFQLMTIGENHRKLFMGLVFALSGEELLTEKDFDKLVRTIIRFFMFSVKLLDLDNQLLAIQSKKVISFSEVQQNNNQPSQIVKNLVLKPLLSDHDSQKHIDSKPQLSQTFEQILEQLQITFPVFKDLKQNIKKKLNQWIKFFTGIQTKLEETTLQTLLQPYNDINRGYFGIFVALLCPSKLQTWVDTHLFEEDLTKISDVQTMSNQTRILSLGNKFNIKQTALIGDESLKLLTSLATRTKKQLRLYSHLELYEKQTSYQKDIISSKPVSRREILQLPQVSFFTERKISQQIMDELQNCMKSSTWLVIDLKGLIKQTQSPTEKYNNIDFLIKIVDSLTNPSTKFSGGQYSRQNSDHSLLQPLSSPSIKSIQFGKNDFNAAAFSSYDYHIFFIVPKSIKRQIFELTNLNKNSKRFIMELRGENDLSKYYSLNKLYHQQLMMSKRMVKDYQVLNPVLREIICSGMEIVGHVLQNSLQMNMGFEFLSLFGQSIINKNGLQFYKAKEMVDKLSKILMIIMQDPEIIKQMFYTIPKTMRKIPISTLSIAQQQPKSSKGNIEPKITGHLHRQQSHKKRVTIKLMLKEALNEDEKDDFIDKKQVSKISIGSKKNLFETQSSQQKETKLMAILRLLFNYFMSSLDQRQSCTTSLTYFLSKYKNQYQKEDLDDVEEHNELYNNKMKIAKIICNPDSSKVHTTNKSTLQELVELLISINDKKIKHTQKLLKDQATKTLLLSKSNIQSNKFNNFKFLLERGLQLKRDQIHSQKFLDVIKSLNETKKQLESSIIEIKSQFFPVTQINNQSSQNQSNNQFNFSSLTENLTLQEMRKKLNITDNAINKNARNEIKNTQNQNQSLQNLIRLFLRLHSNVVDQIDSKVEKLKNLKTVFLLGNINYQLLKDWWTKNVASCMCSEIIEILQDMDRHKEQTFVNELKKVMQIMKNPKRFLISQFKNLTSEMLPVFNLKLINGAAEFEQLLHQLKCTFLEINRLKNQHIKVHFKIEQNKEASKHSLMIQEVKRQGKLYKICGFTQFQVSGLIYEEQKSAKKKQVVFRDAMQQISNDYNENLRLVLCFQVCEQENLTDSESQSEDYEQEQVDNEIKQLRIPFFMRQCQKANNIEQSLNRKVGDVTVSVIRNIDIEESQKKEIFFVYH